jgi:hypothetical protein
VNNIITKQNEPKLIRLLQAQHVAYSDAKTYYWIDALSVLLVLIAFCAQVFGWKCKILPKCLCEFGCKNILAVLGVVLWMVTQWISEWRADAIKKGAIIQEMFDVALFELSWNEIKIPQKILMDDIVSLSTRCPKINFSNWYSTEISADLPYNIAILLCFRNNIAWGIKDNEKYTRILSAFLFIFVLILLIDGIFNQKSFSGTLLLIAPCISLLRYCIDAIKNHRAFIKKHKDLAAVIQKWLDKYAKSTVEPSVYELRQLQDEFFIQRTTMAKIPDWFHYMHKQETNVSVEKVLKNIIDTFKKT